MDMVSGWLGTFVLTFVPLFIAIDSLGNLPFVVSLSDGMTRHERHKMIYVAGFTAGIVGVVFLFFRSVFLDRRDV